MKLVEGKMNKIHLLSRPTQMKYYKMIQTYLKNGIVYIGTEGEGVTHNINTDFFIYKIIRQCQIRKVVNILFLIILQGN